MNRAERHTVLLLHGIRCLHAKSIFSCLPELLAGRQAPCRCCPARKDASSILVHMVLAQCPASCSAIEQLQGKSAVLVPGHATLSWPQDWEAF